MDKVVAVAGCPKGDIIIEKCGRCKIKIITA